MTEGRLVKNTRFGVIGNSARGRPRIKWMGILLLTIVKSFL